MSHDHDHDHDAPGHHELPGVDAHQVIADPCDAPAPAQVLELAAACVRFVATSVKIAPDFAPDTMSLVDHYVREARRTLASHPEALALTANAVGAYLGEVVRRAHRCWWRAEGVDPAGWRLEFEAVKLAFYPVQVAYGLLTDEEEESQFSGFELDEADRDDVAARLAELPPVSEEEYLLPSTRLEVLDIAVEALVGKRIADPLANAAHRPEDYA